MPGLEEAIERIKDLECPTGDLENRVAGILEDYGVARRDEVLVQREQELDNEEAIAYIAELHGDIGQEIIIMSKSGADDYVAKVLDAYPG